MFIIDDNSILFYFLRNAVVAHKTFHRYTVRAKRGTIQGVQDKKGAGVAK